MDLSDILKWNGQRIIPCHIVLETIFGCNAECDMCVINYPTPRKKGVMSPALFDKIVETLVLYKEQIEMFDFIGLGEPLLDPYLFERLKILKSKGFRNLAISSNADLLLPDKQKSLLDTGIETVLFSIDGVTKETHESIRKGVSFDRAVKNIKGIIKMRDSGGFKTRFIMRFIRQAVNQSEWGAYKSYWEPFLCKDKGDFITAYDMHTWGGEIASKCELLSGRCYNLDAVDETTPCHHLFEKMIILADGSVALCSEDLLRAQYGFGNINNDSPLDIYNSKEFNDIRRIHIAGNRNSIMPCRECTVLYSEASIMKG